MISKKRPIETPTPEVAGQSLHPANWLNPSTQAHILLAEDGIDIRGYLAQVLRRVGYLVTAVEDGRQAWEVLQAKACDLLITDNDMPHLTGVQLVAKARGHGLDLPVIMVSGNLDKITTLEIESLQFAALLQKPVVLGNLLATIARAVSPQNKSH